MKNATQYLLFAAKIALSVALIVYAFGKIDLSEAWLHIRRIPPWAVAATAAVLLTQAIVAALRLRQILRMLGTGCRLIQAIDVFFVGAFFSQTLISFVGGDAMRIWRIVRANVPLGLATKAVVLDRTAGLAGVLGLVLLTLPFLFEVVKEPVMRTSLLVALVCGISGFAFLLSLRRLPLAVRQVPIIQWVSDLAATATSMVQEKKRLAFLLGSSLVVQILNVVALYVLALGLSIEITFWHGLVLMPPVLFLSMLPISFAGWGVREGAMIVALGLVGVSPAKSVALSVCFGLSLITISLPGALLWLLRGGAGFPASPTGADASGPDGLR